MKPYYLVNDICVCCGAFAPDRWPLCRDCEQGTGKGRLVRASLLDLMSIQMGCDYLSELRFLDHARRAELAEKLGRFPAEDADLHDWNDALNYLTGDGQPRATAEQAKSALIAGLTAR